MMKINTAKEMVDNHTTEEVLDWMESALRREVFAINSEYSEGNEAFFLGRCAVDLQEIHDVVLALKNKLGSRSPIVA